MEKKRILLIALIPVLIILLNVIILIYNESFYFEQIHSNQLNNKELSEELTWNLLSYFHGETTISDKFSEREKIHLEDVKNLLHLTSLLSYIILIISLIVFIKNLHAYGVRRTLDTITYGSEITLIIIALIAFFSLIDFNNLFNYFHKVFFTNNYWLLNENSLLILMYPQEFFNRALRVIITRSAIISTGAILLNFMLKTKVIKRIYH